ncbi:MAG TPA: protease complex subunit PrcB family protein [Pyrinomonadaceae bacterium]|jgi:hypothetical protein
MLFAKTSLILATTFLLVNTHGAGPLDNKNVSVIMAEPSPTPQKGMDTTNGDIKVLAEGSHSEVTSPFLAVVRDEQVYARLRKLATGLPELQEDFFKRRAVIAAFMGERNTGGYRVEITRAADDSIHLAAMSPPGDAMVAQVITTPFKVVAVPTNRSLALEADSNWQKAMRSYHITSGQFSISGGFAGRTEQFALDGGIRVMREGELVTFLFDLKSVDVEKPRSLKESATGLVDDDSIVVPRIGAGSLVEVPHGDLSVTGSFTDKKSKLALSFISLPTMIADGYGGGGSIEAQAGTPQPQKKQLVKNQ